MNPWTHPYQVSLQVFTASLEDERENTNAPNLLLGLRVMGINHHLKNVKTGATEEITFQSDSTDQLSDQESDVDLLNMVVYLKDRYNMSGNTFVYMYTLSLILAF